MPTNMWATPTTTLRYVLVEERLQKETRTPHTWVLLTSNANSKCGGGMWVPQVSPSYVNSLCWFGNGVSSCFLLHKRKKWKKIRGVAMVTTLSLHQQKRRGKYSQCPAFDIKQSPARRSPEDHRFVLMLISFWIMLDHASCFLYL